jgi:hypothetical protein
MEGNAKSVRTSSALLFLGAVLPFLLSCAAFAVGSTAKQATQGAKRPALAFEQYLVNLGPVPVKNFVFARFAFTNTGSTTVKVTSLEGSCSCLKPRLEKRIYQPGESGKFFLQVETPKETPGRKEYFCTVKYEDPQPREVELTFQVILPVRGVAVKPRGLAFYQLGGDSTTQNLFVTDFRPQPLHVSAVECNADFVSVKLAEADKDEDGNRRYRISVTVAAKVPPGKHWPIVVIRTDDPEFSTLKVPLRVQGPESKAIQVSHESGAKPQKR